MFCSNKIKTSRYTPWSFLPLTFLLQFTKLGNIVWLCVAICNFFPAVAVNQPYVIITVLSFIIVLGIIKEGITDYIRYKSDTKINAIKCEKLGQHMQVLQVQLQDVKVGDILLLKDNQLVPADCVMLGSKNGTDGYIQTAQLDGERNLKAKIPVV